MKKWTGPHNLIKNCGKIARVQFLPRRTMFQCINVQPWVKYDLNTQKTGNYNEDPQKEVTVHHADSIGGTDDDAHSVEGKYNDTSVPKNYVIPKRKSVIMRRHRL